MFIKVQIIEVQNLELSERSIDPKIMKKNHIVFAKACSFMFIKDL